MWLQNWLSRRRETAALAGTASVLCGKPGPAGHLPSVDVALKPINTTVLAGHSGPEGGIENLRACAPDLVQKWDESTDWACGDSRSLYDASPSTGRRNGEPIADCFAVLGYSHAAVLAVADGVNWGDPPRRAARCAVLGCMQHMWNVLRAEADAGRRPKGAASLDPTPAAAPPPASPCGGGAAAAVPAVPATPPTSSAAGVPLTTAVLFRHMIESLQLAQKMILRQQGSMTTLVVSCVCRCLHLKPPHKWALLTITVGDSAAYVYRAGSRRVEEVTAGSHEDVIRDPRWCLGGLGYAKGPEPDLGNMTCSLTFLEDGDIVFLASDGVADNFDPVVLHVARHELCATPTDDDPRPIVTAREAHGQAMQLLTNLLTQGAMAAAAAAPAQGGGGGGAGTGGGSAGGLTARGVCSLVLDHVHAVTADHRAAMEQRSREREAAREAAREEAARTAAEAADAAPHVASLRDAFGSRSGPASSMPKVSGKLDHATVVAYQVGKRKAAPQAAAPPAADIKVAAAHSSHSLAAAT